MGPENDDDRWMPDETAEDDLRDALDNAEHVDLGDDGRYDDDPNVYGGTYSEE